MRPIQKGECPKDDAGNKIEYEDYQNARGALIERLGEYCSYCEMHLDAALAVEHILPKKPRGASTVCQERVIDWDNYLLSCSICNSTKGNNDINLQDYLWPHLDNTFLAFFYSEGGLIMPSDLLPESLKTKARDTLHLTGLDKNPGNDHKYKDRRCMNRKECWEIAQRQKKNLQMKDTNEMRSCIESLALAKGYWSIWMTIFQDDPDMLCRFINAFKGTASDCFDSTNRYKPVSRNGGQV